MPEVYTWPKGAIDWLPMYSDWKDGKPGQYLVCLSFALRKPMMARYGEPCISLPRRAYIFDNYWFAYAYYLKLEKEQNDRL